MTAFLLAWRTVRRYRAQTILAIAGVAVIGALLFDMLLLSRGLLLSFADLLDQAGFTIRVVGGGALTARLPIPDSMRLIDEIRKLPDVERVGAIRLEPATVRVHGGQPYSVTLIGATDLGKGGWTIARGGDLDAAVHERCPLVVSRPLTSTLALEPGAEAQVNVRPPGIASAMPPLMCRVVGVADFAFGPMADESIATTMTAFREAAADGAAGDAELILVATRPDAQPAAAAAAIQRLAPALRVYSNQDVVEQFNRNGFAYFRQISLVLSSLTMVFAFLLVATLLTVSVNQRLGEIAALRAIGIGRPRIAAMLLWESALLVGSGGLLALPIGELLAVGLDRLLKQMPGLPEQLHFFVFEPRAVVVHAALLVITAIAAAAYPVWLTARLPIAATLRREVVG